MEAVHAESDWADIRATLGGDEDAYARLVLRYQAQVFKQMWRFARDPDVQEELVQEVFIEVYRSLRSFKGRAPFLHWICRVATRVGYRYWKYEAKGRRLREAIEQQPIPEWAEPEDQAPSEAACCLYELLARLSTKDRLLLTLIYFEECDGKAIAERLGWSENLVRVRAHRARERLKKLLLETGVGR
ncbi:MAG: RNA polymerase sigma factor [Candidatus Lindowbacteria bacterium]|nr:RNA polymerase sigma factor [Candidatus Lindowbacteria bacterium]